MPTLCFLWWDEVLFIGEHVNLHRVNCTGYILFLCLRRKYLLFWWNSWFLSNSNNDNVVKLYYIFPYKMSKRNIKINNRIVLGYDIFQFSLTIHVSAKMRHSVWKWKIQLPGLLFSIEILISTKINFLCLSLTFVLFVKDKSRLL